MDRIRLYHFSPFAYLILTACGGGSGGSSPQNLQFGVNIIKGPLSNTTNFENIKWTSSEETITGDDNANTLKGNRGGDTINGLGGNDILYGQDFQSVGID